MSEPLFHGGRHYGEHVDRAIGALGRAERSAGDVRGVDWRRGMAFTVVHVGEAVASAVLALADRVDVLIDGLFDERVPIRTVAVDDLDDEGVADE